MATKRKKAAVDGPFQRVWKILLRVPRGKVVTYGLVSQMIERRLTPVAIGWAIRAAPPGLLPWQRVINANGGISTDRHHPGLQRELLEAEGIVFDRDGTIDLTRYLWTPRAPTARKTPSKKRTRAPSRPTRSC